MGAWKNDSRKIAADTGHTAGKARWNGDSRLAF